MAITRCPYCHAIIDEHDKYCNNCGTQLLFNEDDEIEEEIPGEKIIDADVEEKDYTVNEPKDEKRPAASKDLDAEIREELGEEEEVILVDEIEAPATAGAAGGSAASGRVEPAEAEKAERAPEPEMEEEEVPEDLAEEEEELAEEELAGEFEEDLGAEPQEEKSKPATAEAAELKPQAEVEGRDAAAVAAPSEVGPVEAPTQEPVQGPSWSDIETVEEAPVPDESATAGEGSLRPVTFDSKEFEDLGKTVEMSREKIDKFVEVLASKQAETGPVPEEQAAAATPEPSTGTLPPWASVMRGAPSFTDGTPPAEPGGRAGSDAETPSGEEIEIFPRRRGSDSTIGLPEKVSQAPLPFDAPPTPSEEGAREAREPEPEAARTDEHKGRDLTPPEVILAPGPVRPARETLRSAGETPSAQTVRPGIELAGEIEEAAPRPPFSFAVFLKSKTFDVLFVGLFWLVALWLAASSMGMTLFEILGSMSGSMLLLYAVFVLLYFFLFKFFLGETLGDRLFRPHERD